VIPNLAINTPLVGIMRFEKPSPGIKASTAVCLEIFSRSEGGTIKGMVTSACPDAEGIKSFNTAWKKNIPEATRVTGKC